MLKNTRAVTVKKREVQLEKMEERISALKTAEECEIFSRNVAERGYPELAAKAQRRAVDLHVATHETQGELEKDALAAVYAFQYVLSVRNGKKTRATAVWQLIKRLGFVEAIQRVVKSPGNSGSYAALQDAGMPDLAFESVVVKYADSFNGETVTLCNVCIAGSA